MAHELVVRAVCVCVSVQLKVMNGKLFSVEPQHGRLLAGDTCTVTLGYQHCTVGTDRVPVMFKLNRGRQILVRTRLCRITISPRVSHSVIQVKGTGSPYSIAERRVPELIPVLGSQPAGDVNHKPGGIGCYCFPPGLQLPPQPLRRLLPVSLLGEQRHDGCEQFA